MEISQTSPVLAAKPASSNKTVKILFSPLPTRASGKSIVSEFFAPSLDNLKGKAFEPSKTDIFFGSMLSKTKEYEVAYRSEKRFSKEIRWETKVVPPFSIL